MKFRTVFHPTAQYGNISNDVRALEDSGDFNLVLDCNVNRRNMTSGRVAPRVDAGQELIAPGAAPLRNLRNTYPQQVSPSQIAQLFNAMAS